MTRISEQGMDTRPDERDISQPKLGPTGMLRWAWRQLTSMRTALFLLLLLAIGAVPGSIWPQRNIDAGRVFDYLEEHRDLGPWLDRLGFFDVYSSPWFAAIYLLLFISLVGCVVPRSKVHWRAMRAQPPPAPRRLERLPEHGEIEVEASPDEALHAAREVLRAKRYRLRATRDKPSTQDEPSRAKREGVHDRDDDAVSAESGYLRETGNLLFHVALIVVIVGIAAGHLFGWRGDRIVPVGDTFSNTIAAYDTLDPGPWVDTDNLRPFSVRIDRLDVTFEERAGGAQRGAPRDFTASTTTTESPGAPARQQTLKVNGPLTFGGASVFLLGNGYAPVVTVKDAQGRVTYTGPTPFLPQDNNYTSVGAVKVASAAPKQLGFTGVLLPSAVVQPGRPPFSVFPDLLNPTLLLDLYEGELYPDGRPQSVYALSRKGMAEVKDADSAKALRLMLTRGQTVELPGGRGSITFDSVVRWAGLSVRYDPGKLVALGGAIVALLGLIASLTIRRRRVFVRVRPLEPAAAARDGAPDPATPRTVVSVGGLAKGEDAALGATVEGLLSSIAERTGTRS